MSLAISYDIADAYVAERAFSVIDAVARTHDPAGFVLENVWVLPGSNAVTLLPDQILPTWASATGKWAAADWTHDSSRWEVIPRRAAGDWFFASKGLATATGTPGGTTSPFASVATLAENAGIYTEVYGYGVPDTRIPDLLQITFGGGLTLHVHSDGHADLEDQRPASVSMGINGYLTKNQPLTSGDQAGSKTGIQGKLLGIVVFPYRRGRLLIATNQGGYFEVSIGGRDDTSGAYSGRLGPGETAYHITTEAGPLTAVPSPLVRGLFAVNPLTCLNTLVGGSYSGAITSPVLSLPYAVSAEPSSITGDSDQQDGSGIVINGYSPDGSAFAPSLASPLQELIYQAVLTSPSPTVFPVLYSLEIKWERILGSRTYGTSVLPTAHPAGPPSSGYASVPGIVTGCKIGLSRDRQQKHFEFTLDNPGDTFTSIKDLWNRRVRCVFDSGGADSVLVGGGPPLPVFDGYADPADFTDGVESKITISCSGRRKRLRFHLLNDSQKFDGMLDTDTVRQILHDAGVDDSDMVIFDVEGRPLDSADPGDDPLWRPTNGQSADEFIQHIADTFSGWVFDDIGGVFYYVPKEYFTAAALAASPTVPTVYQTTPYSFGIPGTRAVNSSALVALAGSVKQSSREPLGNDFWVLGQDADGNIVSAHYEDLASINDRTAANWVGERRLILYVSGSITSVEAAQAAIGPLVLKFGQAERDVVFDLPDYQINALPLEGPLILDGYGPALITELDADLSCDRSRKTHYNCELL